MVKFHKKMLRRVWDYFDCSVRKLILEFINSNVLIFKIIKFLKNTNGRRSSLQINSLWKY
jgi:hypothetical protein